MEAEKEITAENNNYANFRLHLQSKLAERCQKNPRYSLRSFARNLGVHHGTLSQILRGQRPISKKMFLTLAGALDLGPNEIRKFSHTSVVETPKIPMPFSDLTIDVFNLISDWYHDAILELMRLKTFKSDPKWIAQALGITASEANIAIERLKRLELIEVGQDGKWISHAAHTEVGIDGLHTTTALKKYQKTILEKAIHAIDEVSREHRHNISTTLAMDSRDIGKVKNMFNDFRRKLSRYVQRKGVRADVVYQMGMCLYPLTRQERTKK